MWFEALFGFREEHPEQVREQLFVDYGYLCSRANGHRYRYGRLDIPMLANLRALTAARPKNNATIRVREVVGDVRDLLADPANAGAVFQVASQFNLLEMVGPHVSPAAGVSGYAYDLTQGPACAIACGAATVYRNYFVPLHGQIGQTGEHQINCLEALGTALDNSTHQYWSMRNGYALPSQTGLRALNERLYNLSPTGYDALRAQLQVGVQWDVEVTSVPNGHSVTQVFCSALPVAYSSLPAARFGPFAQLVLRSSYEATFHVALQNYARTGNAQLYLTLLGGGAFGNMDYWIEKALLAALHQFAQTPLRVNIISYGEPSTLVRSILEKFST